MEIKRLNKQNQQQMAPQLHKEDHKRHLIYLDRKCIMILKHIYHRGSTIYPDSGFSRDHFWNYFSVNTSISIWMNEYGKWNV